MVDVRQDAVDRLESHAETMSIPEFVRIAEAHHSPGRGVDGPTLAAYAEAVYFEVDPDEVDEILIESAEWQPGEHVYLLENGNVSAYPQHWHDAFDDLDDVLDLVAIIYEEVTEPEGDQRTAVTETGVPDVKVARVAETVSTVDRDDVDDRVDELLDDGVLEEPNQAERYPYLRPA